MTHSPKKTVLSAIQPTGDLHLGNYLGAVRNWVGLQSEYDCIYGVANNHSMTMPYNPKKLSENTWNLCFQLLACGVEAENLFIQSMIPEHTELCWILSCVCSYGELSRMTQFKDKSRQISEQSKDTFISAGLVFYPILQAADILIYRADYVPVGKDQEQHLELSRNIASRFNSVFGSDYFAAPEALFSEIPKVYSLADPSRKMSKSLGEKHYVNLFGDRERVKKQIKSAVTDTGEGDGISPGVNNLLGIYRHVGGDTSTYSQLQCAAQDGTLKYSELKEELVDVMDAFLAPIQDRYSEIIANKKEYKSLIKASSREVRIKAQATLQEVRALVGLSNPVVV